MQAVYPSDILYIFTLFLSKCAVVLLYVPTLNASSRPFPDILGGPYRIYSVGCRFYACDYHPLQSRTSLKPSQCAMLQPCRLSSLLSAYSGLTVCSGSDGRSLVF